MQRLWFFAPRDTSPDQSITRKPDRIPCTDSGYAHPFSMRLVPTTFLDILLSPQMQLLPLPGTSHHGKIPALHGFHMQAVVSCFSHRPFPTTPYGIHKMIRSPVHSSFGFLPSRFFFYTNIISCVCAKGKHLFCHLLKNLHV